MIDLRDRDMQDTVDKLGIVDLEDAINKAMHIRVWSPVSQGYYELSKEKTLRMFKGLRAEDLHIFDVHSLSKGRLFIGV